MTTLSIFSQNQPIALFSSQMDKGNEDASEEATDAQTDEAAA